VKGNDLIQRFKITNKKADLGYLYETIDMLRFSEPPQVNAIKDLSLYQLQS
jgi:hypothetical protein